MSEIDTGRLARWLADTVDPAITSATATRLSNGYSGGAWRIDAGAGDGTRSYVLKAPGDETMVFRRDLVHEGRALAGLHAGGAPVPEVLAIDGAGAAIGRPCLLMELVPGRGPADEPISGYHDDPWLHGLGPTGQRAVWASFYDALAAVHSVDAAAAPEGTVGRGGLAEVLGYWRESLLDVAPAGTVPRQLALLDWLTANRPPRADEATAPCMGDARLANAVVAGTDVQALVDFEVLYLGNPAADVGYSTFAANAKTNGRPVLRQIYNLVVEPVTPTSWVLDGYEEAAMPPGRLDQLGPAPADTSFDDIAKGPGETQFFRLPAPVLFGHELLIAT